MLPPGGQVKWEPMLQQNSMYSLFLGSHSIIWAFNTHYLSE